MANKIKNTITLTRLEAAAFTCVSQAAQVAREALAKAQVGADAVIVDILAAHKAPTPKNTPFALVMDNGVPTLVYETDMPSAAAGTVNESGAVVPVNRLPAETVAAGANGNGTE